MTISIFQDPSFSSSAGQLVSYLSRNLKDRFSHVKAQMLIGSMSKENIMPDNSSYCQRLKLHISFLNNFFLTQFLAHLSSELIVYPCSGVRPSLLLSVHHFQRSFPLKSLCQSKPNFMWSLLDKVKQLQFIYYILNFRRNPTDFNLFWVRYKFC